MRDIYKKRWDPFLPVPLAGEGPARAIAERTGPVTERKNYGPNMATLVAWNHVSGRLTLNTSW
jgi:hypothetical protein